MFKFYKILFFNSMILGTIITISAYSWMSMWMGLEINLLSIIPLMNNSKNMYSTEASMKYFITQALASMILMFSIISILSIMEYLHKIFHSTFILIMSSSIMMKLGAAPFHFWFPEVMEGLSWWNCLILMSWQKIAPMIMIMNIKMNYYFTFLIIMFSLIISSFMGFNQSSLRKILSFSSINHISWMLSSTLCSFSIWMIYFMIYTILNFIIVFSLKITNTFHMKQIFNIFNNNKILKLLLMSSFLSLGGLPPFLGFLPKWFLIHMLIQYDYSILCLFLITLTLIFLYIYTRLIFTSLIIQINEMKKNSILTYNWTLIFINSLSLMLLFICTLLMNLF